MYPPAIDAIGCRIPESSSNFTKYSFTSEGKNGHVDKEVEFQMLIDNLYNLAFGDKCLITGQIDDLVVSDNGDTEKVLATTVAAVLEFLKKYPLMSVRATGSTASRNRMYRMGISKYYQDIEQDFYIIGILEEIGFEPYQKDKNYVGFAIKSKKA